MKIKEILSLKKGDRVIQTHEYCLDEDGLGTTRPIKNGKVRTILSRKRHSFQLSGKSEISGSSMCYFYEKYTK